MSKKKLKKVLVVLGGTSGERAVSLDSGKACIKALKKKNYSVSTFDPKYKNFNLIRKEKVDVIFNALHGKDGEDGVAQSYFEYLRIPYTHSGVISSFNCMNKVISKEIFMTIFMDKGYMIFFQEKSPNSFECHMVLLIMHTFSQGAMRAQVLTSTPLSPATSLANAMASGENVSRAISSPENHLFR